MMKLFAAVVLAFVALAPPAHAAQLDVATVTCKDIPTYGAQKTEALIFWMEGNWQGRHQQKLFQPEGMNPVGQKLGPSCTEKPDGKLLDIYNGLRAAPAAYGTDADFAKVTCGQYLTLPPEGAATTWFWMDGQIHGAKNSTLYDPAQVGPLFQKLRDTCKDRASDPVLAVETEITP